MKLVKTTAIAAAISALLAGPVLAQGASSGGGTQGKTQMQSGAPGAVKEDHAGRKAGATAKTGMKSTVGTGSGKVTGGPIAPATGR